jgi:methylenetetrahydrofolate dehydrogenase (NADP+)/methenyltetrahydrofolate cyclohydrolase
VTARVLDGKALAARVRADVTSRVQALPRPPGLAVVLVGDDPASAIYVRGKTKAAAECGIAVFDHKLPASTTETELLALVARLNADDAVHGILVQLPVPPQIDPARVIRAIAPAKDVDGLHPENVGALASGAPRFIPCTPKGCLALLVEAGAPLRGARALVVGRSNLVGKPMAQVLLARDATVTIAHSRTQDLAAEVARAEILVVAIGRPAAIRAEWVQPGAIVIDVGMNRLESGTLVGDVEPAAAERAAAITPVPGGVGPMTIAMLLENTLEAAR